MQYLKVCLIQPDLIWENKEANLNQLESYLSKMNHADLIVLPEMFQTGFSMRSMELAEPMEGNTLQWMKQWAKKLDVLLCGSFIVKEGECYNRLLAVKPSGEYDYYDKKHLFRMGQEEENYAAGHSKTVLNYMGWTINPFICYDLRFPVWCRNTNQADLMLFVANWPERRKEHWRALLVARAIENQAYVLGVNRVGEDGNGVNHSGNSMVVNPKGEIEIELENQAGCIEFTLSKAFLESYKTSFPAYKDADSFKIE